MVDVAIRYDARTIVTGVTWTVRRGERWVVLGRNGCGKSSLVRLASGYQHPTSGEVHVLGERLGRTDIRRLRPRVGLTSASLAAQLRDELVAHEAVMTAKNGALEPWWHTYDDADRARARALLGRVGMGAFADRSLWTLSSGERQRVLLARTLMTDPELLLLDEPTAGLDLGGREELVATLELLAADPTTPPSVLVTHHVDEIPPSTTHVLLVAGGRVLAQGPVGATLTAGNLSACFGLELSLEERDGRWSARAVGRVHPDGVPVTGEG
jgi:iron complex transport system ATP-binding protein